MKDLQDTKFVGLYMTSNKHMVKTLKNIFDIVGTV